MKILAIRGCNLASLAGEFEIDLSHGPLSGAGVFAIVGNTGAGKSTLLDALCVALFDRTPRLTNHSTVKVGRGLDEKALLGAQDVRTLLRRGTSQGWAEVDFESGDARQYRARWSVRRARGQSDGTLQDEQLSLVAIEGGERFGGTKTETLKAIHARLGLSFDQFRRSALLAQGEFAAFLRADGKDRSELLERMTGTQIYSRLSIAAHVKAALAEQRLRDGRIAALAIPVLDDEAEHETQRALEAATVEAGRARRRHAAAEQAARWLAEAVRRAQALAAVEAEHAAARVRLVAAEDDRAELMLRRRAELLRPAWDEAARLERGVGIAAGEVSDAGAAVARAAAELAAIGERRAKIAAMQAPVRAARIAAGIVERAAADRAEPIARSALEDAAWLAGRSALAPEVAAWPELDARFAQHGALGEAIAGLDRALTEQVAAKAKLAKAQKVAASELQAATRKHEDAKRKASSFAQKRGLTLDAARRLEDEARNRLGEVERLVALAQAARAAIERRDEIDHALAEGAAAAAADVAQRAQLGEARRLAEAMRAEQGRVVEELRRAAGYEHARAELVDGEPCPLCGAAEHPWRDRGALDGVIANAADRLSATVAEIDAICTLAAAIVAREQHHAREQARLGRERAAVVAGLASGVATWRERLGALGELMLVDDPAVDAAEALAADRQAIAKKKLEEARATRHQTEAATKAAQDAQADVQLCQVAVDHLASKLADLDRRVAELEAAIGRARGERISKAEQHAALARALAAAMMRWHAALPADGDVAGTAPSVDVGSPSRASASPRLAKLGAGASPSGASDSAGASPTADAEAFPSSAIGDDGTIDPALAIALVTRLAASAASRHAPDVMPNAPLAIVRIAMVAVVTAWRERAERIAHADAALAAATTAIEGEAREADRAVAEHTARRGDAERRRDALAAERTAATTRLAAVRSAAGFEADELQRLLSSDASRVDALAERLAALDRAIERTRVVVAERERQVADHAEARPAYEEADDDADGHLSAKQGAEADGAAPPTQAAGAAARATKGNEPAEQAAQRWPGDDASQRDDAAEGEDVVRAKADRQIVQLAAAVDALALAVTAAEQRAAQLRAVLAADAQARTRRAAALADVAADEASAEVDRILGDVIGSHDGKLFRSFAQSLTLDGLLAVANAHLEELAPRYQLERVPRHDLELQVIDRDLGSEVRSVQSLSGGESFLVSLALALGLSSMSAHDVRVRTLLIDEGFGTLDPATLDSALSVLDALQATGRQVGVISHVPALVERVGAHVRVVQRGGGRSEVIVS